MRKCAAVLVAAIALFALALPALAEEPAEKASAGAKVTGSIVNKDGKPVANAEVTVQVHSGGKWKTETVTSDKEGKFTSTLTPDEKSGYGWVTALAKGYCCGRQYFNLGEKPSIDITLWPGFTLKGKVVDEQGKLLAGAKVQMQSAYAYGGNTNIDVELPDKLRSVTTGKDGAFSFGNLPSPDDFSYVNAQFAISAPGRALIHKNVSKDQMSSVVKITDPLECKLDGTLYLPGKTGVAPEGTQLMLQVFTDQGGSESRGATVGKDGKFHFAQIPPGNVNVLLDRRYDAKEPLAWALPAVMDVPLSPKKAKELELVLVPGALIKGTITDQATGKGVESARLSITHPGRPEGTFADYAQTDANGEFRIRVVEGDVSIEVESVDGRDRHVWYQPEQRPSVGVKVASGEEKTDVALKIDLNQSDQGDYAARDKPIPDDFELKPGTYGLTWDPDLDCSGAVYVSAKYQGDDAGSRMKKLPKLASENAKQMAFPLDGSSDSGLLFAIFDESKGTGKGWDTAYIDLNRNRDLTDDEPVHFVLRQGGGARAGWATVQARQGAAGGDRTDHPVQVSFNIYNGGTSPYIRFARKGGWKGTIETSKGTVDCALVDSNSNGVCTDRVTISSDMQPRSPGDMLFVNTNGYSKLVTAGWSPHLIYLQGMSQVGGKFYDIRPSQLGDKVTVEPYSGKLGQIAVRGEKIEGMNATTQGMMIIGSSGYYPFEKCGDEPITVPVGTYKIYSCQMILDAKSKLNLTCAPDALVVVNAEKQSVVTVSGKLSLAIDSARKEMLLQPGETQTIGWDIKIGGKTTVSALGDQDRSRAPKVNFLKNGKVLKTTTAGYT